MNKDRLTEQGKNNVEFFRKVFTELIDKWKKETGKTQRDFADEMKMGSANSISRWKKGSEYPTSENIERMADIFGVSPSVFYPQSTIDRYRYSTEYQDKGTDLLLKQSYAIDLDPNFLRAVKGIDDFGSIFPAFNISRIPSKNIKGDAFFKRLPLLSAAEPTNDIMHFYKDGQYYRLSVPDLIFLKDVQTELEEYVRFLFAQHEKELERKTELLNELHIENVEKHEGGVSFVNASGLTSVDISFIQLSDMELLKKLVDIRKDVDSTEIVYRKAPGEGHGAIEKKSDGSSRIIINMEYPEEEQKATLSALKSDLEKSLDEEIKDLREWILTSAFKRSSSHSYSRNKTGQEED